MPRILYLSLHGDLARGGQRSLLHLLQNLDYTQFYAGLVVPCYGNLAEEASSLGLKVYESSWEHSISRSLLKTPAVILRLHRIIQDFKPNIIHADAPRNTHFAALVKGKAKLLVHLRVANFDRFSDRLLAAETDAMIAVSRGAAGRFLRYPEHVRRKVHVIHNGVDIKRFHPVSERERGEIRNRYELPADRPLVGFLAGFVPFKRHDFLLDLWGRVIAQAGMVTLALAGQGRESERRRLQRRVETEGLSDSVRFLPFLEKPEEFLPGCDLLVLPSADTREEGFPRVLIEAGACGVPAIASDVAGVREGVDAGKSGFRVPPNNSEIWIERLVELLTHPEKRRQMGDYARSWVANRFTIQIHANKVMNLYRTLCPEV